MFPHGTLPWAHRWCADHPPSQRPSSGQLKVDGMRGGKLGQLSQDLHAREEERGTPRCVRATAYPKKLCRSLPLSLPSSLPSPPPSSPPAPPAVHPLPPSLPPPSSLLTCEGDLLASCTSRAMGTRCTPLLTRGRQAIRLPTMGLRACSPAGETWKVTATEAWVEGRTASWPRPSLP